ncbi:MAG: hypothetical protein R3C05_17395 [Pirellulaceae bacterium]
MHSQVDTPTIAQPSNAQTRRIPSWLKLTYTLFVVVLAIYYWREYGPTNFVYFCDVALFLGVAAVWTERPIYASMAAVGITIPQLMWQFDFISSLFGMPILGMTAYMFDTNISLFARDCPFSLLVADLLAVPCLAYGI